MSLDLHRTVQIDGDNQIDIAEVDHLSDTSSEAKEAGVSRPPAPAPTVDKDDQSVELNACKHLCKDKLKYDLRLEILKLNVVRCRHLCCKEGTKLKRRRSEVDESVPPSKVRIMSSIPYSNRVMRPRDPESKRMAVVELPRRTTPSEKTRRGSNYTALKPELAANAETYEREMSKLDGEISWSEDERDDLLQDSPYITKPVTPPPSPVPRTELSNGSAVPTSADSKKTVLALLDKLF